MPTRRKGLVNLKIDRSNHIHIYICMCGYIPIYAYIYNIYIYILEGRGPPPRPQALGEDVGVGFVVFEKMTPLDFVRPIFDIF
jgi:hypothetical protein